MADEKDAAAPQAHWNDILPIHFVNELWRMGYTIVQRAVHADPFHMDPAIIPKDRAYQWIHEDRDLPMYSTSGWTPVPYDRHPGVFGPIHWSGAIKHLGLILVDKPKAEVEAEHRENHRKAQANVDDWFKRQQQTGFTGSANVIAGATFRDRDVGDADTTETQIPRELIGHVGPIMRERDRLIAQHFKDNQKAPDAKTKGLLTQIAINIMRERLRGNRAVPVLVSTTDDQPEKGNTHDDPQQANDPEHPATDAGGSAGDAPSAAGGDPGVTGEDSAERTGD